MKRKKEYIIKLKNKSFDNLIDANNFLISLDNKDLELSYYIEQRKFKNWIPVRFYKYITKFIFKKD